MDILLGTTVRYRDRPFKRTIERLYESGVDYFEFSLDYPLPDCMGKEEREGIKNLLDEFGLRIAFHSPLDLFLAHPREELSDASMHVLKRCMEFAADFLPFSLYYNFHLNSRVMEYKPEEGREKIKMNALRRCEEIREMGLELGLLVSVENVLVPFEESDLIFDALSLSDLYFTFDIGHAIISEVSSLSHERDEIFYLKRWVEKCRDKILVTHLHDCLFRGDKQQDHLRIGKGELDFDAIFKLLKRTNCKYVVIETFWRNKEKEEITYEELKEEVEFCRSYL
jgi:sugar phosphate isomerase/epimerase